jgi:hypothetical protein
MFCMLNPGEIFAIQLYWVRVLHIPNAATEEHALGLGKSWDRVSREDQVVILAMLLTYSHHLLEHLSVWS